MDRTLKKTFKAALIPVQSFECYFIYCYYLGWGHGRGGSTIVSLVLLCGVFVSPLQSPAKTAKRVHNDQEVTVHLAVKKWALHWRFMLYFILFSPSPIFCGPLFSLFLPAIDHPTFLIPNRSVLITKQVRFTFSCFFRIEFAQHYPVDLIPSRLRYLNFSFLHTFSITATSPYFLVHLFSLPFPSPVLGQVCCQAWPAKLSVFP